VASEWPVAPPRRASLVRSKRNGTSVLSGSCQNRGHQKTSILCPQGHSRQQEKKQRKSRPVMSRAAKFPTEEIPMKERNTITPSVQQA
jgi:hypothetical protein